MFRRRGQILSGPVWFDAGPMKTHIKTAQDGLLVGHSGPVFIQLHFLAPSAGERERTPVAFVAVLDRSGSMEGAPLEAARLAALTALRGSRQGDWFGVASFDERAEVVVPCGPTGSREVAEARIQGVRSGGCTDLAGGWSLGRDLLKGAPAGLPRRLILLSDGLANRGLLDPVRIQRLCSEALEADGVRTSVLGFGDDYDENLLSAMASAGHGEFHDATHLRSLPLIFAKELGSTQQTVIEDLKVRVRLHPATRSVRRLGSAIPSRLEDGRLEFPLGDLVADEDKRVLLACDMDLAGLAEGAPVVLVELEVMFNRLAEGVREPCRQVWRVELPVVPVGSAVCRDEETLSWVRLLQAGELVEQAIRLCDAGERDRALSDLDARLVQLQALPETPLNQDAVALLETGKARLADESLYRRGRKQIRFLSSQVVAASSRDSTVFEGGDGPSFKRRRQPRV